MSHRISRLALVLATPLLLPAVVHGADYRITVKNHHFVPAELTIPADQKVELTIENQDATPEEFESHDLHVEKIVAGGSSVTIRLGPLAAGTYRFVGEFHEDTAKGMLIAR
ncbi:MAG: cupredoxin domain-containing protein [Ectothiorhodospiraceae bacterium]|nr:cupredoxin domain-containing protein [Ectothiorhodospiraceae bacterium]